MKTIITGLFAVFAFLNSCSKNKDKKDSFVFIVEDAFQLSSNQIVITGQVTSGEITPTDSLLISKPGKEVVLPIEKMEVFAKPSQNNIAHKGDYVAFTISGLGKSDLQKGTVLKSRTNRKSKSQ